MKRGKPLTRKQWQAIWAKEGRLRYERVPIIGKMVVGYTTTKTGKVRLKYSKAVIGERTRFYRWKDERRW